MSQIYSVFNDKSHKALIAYITAGFPNMEATPSITAALAESGCDIIEIGIPFSDPLADGATIQKASYMALQQGTTTQKCLDIASRIRSDVSLPLVFMTYYNPVLHYGLEKFCLNCRQAGVDGLIIPDLPPEEGAELEKLTAKHELDLIYLLAPTSTRERIATIARRSRGFIYLVSIAGVTGVRQELPLTELKTLITGIRENSQQPICVGFGISTPEQAREVAEIADGVIIGSRLIQLVEEDPSLSSLKKLVSGLRQSLDIGNKP
jgi:tryptophan synthase alpha chain